jgi:hypothetical protein
LAYVDNVNILEGSIKFTKKNTKDLLLASKVILLKKMLINLAHDHFSRSKCRTKPQLFLWKGVTDQILGNKLEESELYSGRN